MKGCKFIVERTNTGYSAYTTFKGGDVAATTGGNLSELRANALESYNGLAEYLNKKTIKAEDISFVFDIPQFFEFYKVINASQLAERVKINRGLLSQYINGNKVPSASQTKRILQGVQQLGRELTEVEFA